MIKSLYLIGSLRNAEIPKVANLLRKTGLEVFDDWFAAGPEADDYWQAYEKGKGNTFGQALKGYAVDNVFSFDKKHLDRVDAVMLVMPAGKSGHLELGYAAGIGKKTYILFDQEPERWDAMYRFADQVFFSYSEAEAFFKEQERECQHELLLSTLPDPCLDTLSSISRPSFQPHTNIENEGTEYSTQQQGILNVTGSISPKGTVPGTNNKPRKSMDLTSASRWKKI